MIFRLAAAVAPTLGPVFAPRLFSSIAERFAGGLPSREHVLGNLRSAGISDSYLPAIMGNFGRYLGEFLCLGGTPPCRASALDRMLGDGDVEELRRVHEDKRGAILMSMHYGNWELGAHAFAREFGAVHVIIRRTGDEFLDRAMALCREGCQLIDVERGALPIFRALESGAIIAAAVDEPRRSGDEAKFFGGTVRYPSALFEAARRTNAALLPTLCRRSATGRIEVEVARPITEPQELADCFERWIRADPSQWIIQRAVF